MIGNDTKSCIIFASFLFIIGSATAGEGAWDPSQPLAWKGLEYEKTIDEISAEQRIAFTKATYPNIRVNSDTTTELQNEEVIVVNPVDPDNVVAVWRDFRLGYRRVGYGYSFDGGHTWTDGLFEGTPYTRDSDPFLTVNSAGTFFAVILSYESTSDPNGLYVFRSSDGGINWDGPFTVIGGVPGVFEDKEVITCDRSTSLFRNNLYVVWIRFYSLQILLSRSTDNGEIWSAPIKLNDRSPYQYPTSAIGPNGEVYVAWLDYSGLLIDRSFDGGITFGADIRVTFTDVLLTLNAGIDAFTHAAMDVDIGPGPRRGTIYIAFMDMNISDTDIYFIKSTDGGDTWTPRVRINDDPIGNGCDQFHPWIFVDHAGAISVTWLDRRLDPGNWDMDLYMTRSTDGGATWSSNERITDVSSNPTAGTKSGLLGEYIGLSGTTDRLNPIWTDTRKGHQDAYTSVISFAPEIPSLQVISIIFLLSLLPLLLRFWK